MHSGQDLEGIEQRAYQTLWEDGLIDLFVGAGVLGIGVSWITGYPVFGAVLPAMLVPMWQAARKRIAEPRSGYVEFSPRRKGRERRGLGILLLVGSLMLTLAIALFAIARHGAQAFEGITPVVIPALPAALLALGAALVGAIVGIHRFLAYAVLLLITGAVGTALAAEPGWHMVASGAAIAAVGVVRLASFLRRYPRPDVKGAS